VRPADRHRHAKCWPEYRRARRPVHPPAARYRPPVSAHPGRTGRRGSIHLARAVSKRRSDPRPTMYPGWLATTMRRFSAAAIRRRHRESPASDWIDTFAPKDLAPELADAVAMEHATARLHQAITQLPERNHASSSCNSVLPITDIRRSAAACICPSEASDPSAAGPFADYEPFSTTSSSCAHHDRSQPFLERAPAGSAPPRPVT